MRRHLYPVVTLILVLVPLCAAAGEPRAVLELTGAATGVSYATDPAWGGFSARRRQSAWRGEISACRARTLPLRAHVCSPRRVAPFRKAMNAR